MQSLVVMRSRPVGRVWRATWSVPVWALAMVPMVFIEGTSSGGPDGAAGAGASEGATCPADLTSNGHVDVDDLLEIINNWGDCAALCPADINGDGVVDADDLLAVINAWGPCPATGPCPGEGDCFASHDTPGCKDADCCNAVCAIDDFCCEVQWDSVCVAEAFDICGTCGDADAGDCCVPHDSPGCDQWECCVEVCIEDPFCCTVTWDSRCADIANATCGFCQ